MKKRRYLVLLLVAVFTIGTILVPERTTYAAKKTQLNKKSVTIEIGKTVTLKLKNAPKGKKIKWTSSKKKVAAMNSKGRVQGKSAGKAKITAKVGKKKYTCTVTVKKKEKPQQVTTEAPTTQTVAEAPTTEAPTTEKEYPIYKYNVVEEKSDEIIKKLGEDPSSEKINLKIENDYSVLLFDENSPLFENSEYLKYLGKITAADEYGNDISENIVIYELGLKETMKKSYGQFIYIC
ncbi:MAG: Ig-like domain-containing protein [Clostridium sp.]|nr:Ig-like domain-containing protein [Clostridium sp.]